jgi:TRAP-type uncharacterized transport system fused permease subunit
VFFIPFMMVYRPELLLNGAWPWIVYHVAITWMAIVAMSGGLIGFLLGPLGWIGRAYLLVASAILFYPSFWADGLGVVMILAFLARRFLSPSCPATASA